MATSRTLVGVGTYTAVTYALVFIPGVGKVVIGLLAASYAAKGFEAVIDWARQPTNIDDIPIAEGAVQEIIDAHAAFMESIQPAPRCGD